MEAKTKPEPEVHKLEDFDLCASLSLSRSFALDVVILMHKKFRKELVPGKWRTKMPAH